MQPLHHPIGLGVEGCSGYVPHPVLAAPVSPRGGVELHPSVRGDFGQHDLYFFVVEMDKKEKINTYLNTEVYNLLGFGQILRLYYYITWEK